MKLVIKRVLCTGGYSVFSSGTRYFQSIVVEISWYFSIYAIRLLFYCCKYCLPIVLELQYFEKTKWMRLPHFYRDIPIPVLLQKSTGIFFYRDANVPSYGFVHMDAECSYQN